VNIWSQSKIAFDFSPKIMIKQFATAKLLLISCWIAVPLSSVASDALTEPLKCASLIWPDWDLSNVEVEAIDNFNDQIIRLKTPETKRLISVRNELVIDRANDVTKVWVNSAHLKDRANRAIYTVYHELFHVTRQSQFGKKAFMRRFQDFSISESAKLAREKYVGALVAPQTATPDICATWDPRSTAKKLFAIDGSRGEAFWLIDRIEGSASYVGARAVAVSKESCTASRESLLKQQEYYISNEQLPNVLRLGYSTHEWYSYIIGSTVGAWFDRCSNNTAWRENISEGASFFELEKQD
jgi:hypothetical protein